jgi:transposase-like protein
VYNEAHGTAIAIRQVRYLNNVVEQDHRAVKRITRPMLGFKSFEAAQSTLAGIELIHMIRKGVRHEVSLSERYRRRVVSRLVSKPVPNPSVRH